MWGVGYRVPTAFTRQAVLGLSREKGQAINQHTKYSI